MAQVPFQHKGGCDSLIEAASAEALLHRGNDLLTLNDKRRETADAMNAIIEKAGILF